MNPIVHFEIHAADMDKMQQFYEQLLGWKFQDMGDKYAGYRTILTGAARMAEPVTDKTRGINGGMSKRVGELPAPDAPVNAFVNIVAVEDVDALCKKALELGGSEAVAPMEVPGVGR